MKNYDFQLFSLRFTHFEVPKTRFLNVSFFRNFVCDVYFSFFEYIAPPQRTKRSSKLNSTRNFGRKRMHTRLLRLLVPKKSKRKIEKNLKYLAQRQMSLAQTFVSPMEASFCSVDYSRAYFFRATRKTKPGANPV